MFAWIGNCRSILLLVLWGWVWLGGDTTLASGPDTRLGAFLQTHCVRCHQGREAEGNVRMPPLIADFDTADPMALEAIYAVVLEREMPPADERQPGAGEREEFLKGLKDQLAFRGREVLDPGELPGQGNLLEHTTLFIEPAVRRAATPARLWRMSPHIFMERANTMARTPLLRAQNNQGGEGLHPAFAYFTPPHTFRDDAGVHRLEPTTTELLFDVCWQIAGLQLDTKRKTPPAPFARVLAKDPSPIRLWHAAIEQQFFLSHRRRPSAEELSSLTTLAQTTSQKTSVREGLQTVLAAVLLKPDAIYRYELGSGEADEHGRVRLAPYELMHAIAYALTDSAPDQPLVQLADSGQLVTREAVKAQVERLLDDEKRSGERLLRFFQEYFEYPAAREVFKDARAANAVFANQRVNDADALVRWILAEDREVLRRLLTEDHLFIGNGASTREPPMQRFRSFTLPDYGFPEESAFVPSQPMVPPVGRRSGILTHPAWLLAFSDNEKNQAIQRGRWIQFKLLGGTVPETPIGVDAKLPTDPHLTLREKMERVTRAEACWRCHRKMDPLGLPLEQYDDFGRWRTVELDRPVVTTGVIDIGDPQVDGPVDDPFEMLQRLAHSTRVEQVFTRHAFRYFFGRNETLEDAPTLIDAHRAYREHGGSFRQLVVSLLTSDSFLYRRLPTAAVNAD